jgi:RNA polymerase sigma factor for flagellar operon FliA
VNKNIKFETYASIKIKGAMIDYIRKQDIFSRRVKKIARNLNDSVTGYMQETGKLPNHEELAAYMGVSEKNLDKMQLETHCLQVLSFEEIAYENGVKNLSLDPVNLPIFLARKMKLKKKSSRTFWPRASRT